MSLLEFLLSVPVLDLPLFGFLDSKEMNRLAMCSKSLSSIKKQRRKSFRRFEFNFHLVDVSTQPVLASQLTFAPGLAPSRKIHVVVKFSSSKSTMEEERFILSRLPSSFGLNDIVTPHFEFICKQMDEMTSLTRVLNYFELFHLSFHAFTWRCSNPSDSLIKWLREKNIKVSRLRFDGQLHPDTKRLFYEKVVVSPGLYNLRDFVPLQPATCVPRVNAASLRRLTLQVRPTVEIAIQNTAASVSMEDLRDFAAVPELLLSRGESDVDDAFFLEWNPDRFEVQHAPQLSEDAIWQWIHHPKRRPQHFFSTTWEAERFWSFRDQISSHAERFDRNIDDETELTPVDMTLYFMKRKHRFRVEFPKAVFYLFWYEDMPWVRLGIQYSMRK